jgi:hypothetical protein
MKVYRLATTRSVRWMLTTQTTAIRQARISAVLAANVTLHCVDVAGSTRQRRGIVEMLNQGMIDLNWDLLLPGGRSSGYYTLPNGEGTYLGYGWRSEWRRQAIDPQFYSGPGLLGVDARHFIWTIYEIPLTRGRYRPSVPAHGVEEIDEPPGVVVPPYSPRRMTPPVGLEGGRDVPR